MMSALTSKLIRPILPNVISSLRTHPYFDLGKKNIDCNFFFIAALGMESLLLSSAEPGHMDNSSS